MTFYYVLGITFVLFAITLTVIGLTREDFPSTPSVGRAVIAAAAAIALVTFGVLVTSSTSRAPARGSRGGGSREEGRGWGRAGGQGRGRPAGKPVEVVEKEYSIEFKQTAFKAGKQKFDVHNEGKVPHDLAVEDGGKEAKTPLIDGGGKASLEVDLKPGKYKLYCTVPGHEQLGMKKEVTVD